MTTASPGAGLSKRSAGVRRLLQEAAELSNDESPDYNAAPLETDLFDWHFTIRGLSSSDFEGGIYHGRMILPSEYPFKPPEIYLLTPSGRFEVNRKICLSISSFHPETWQPSWGVRTALLALIAFFESDPKGAVGSLNAPPEERKRLANASRYFKCSTCGYVAEDHQSFSALPDPAAICTELGSGVELSGDATSAGKPTEEDGRGLDSEREESSETHRHTTTAPTREQPVLFDTPSSPTTIFPVTPTGSRNRSPPAGAFASPTSEPVSPAGPTTRPAQLHREPSPASIQFVSPPVVTARTSAQYASGPSAPTSHRSVPSSASTGGQPHVLPIRQRDSTPSTSQASSSEYPPTELIAGGPPSYIDRAILATLLAIVALIVRKVA